MAHTETAATWTNSPARNALTFYRRPTGREPMKTNKPRFFRLDNRQTLWDSLGNTARVEMFKIGRDDFEVYFYRFNSEVPTRFVGSLGLANSKVDAWLALRKADGFKEQLPSYNPDTWRA